MRRRARWLAARSGPTAASTRTTGAPTARRRAALVALALDDRAAARARSRTRSRIAASRCPNAADPERRTAWGWTNDARSLVEPTARVLLAVNALTPRRCGDAARGGRAPRARASARRRLELRQRLLYGVDLRGYAQTTAIALIALQQGTRRSSRRAFGFLRRQLAARAGRADASRRRSWPSGSTAPRRGPRAPRRAGAISRRPAFLERPLALAWAALATGPDAARSTAQARA